MIIDLDEKKGTWFDLEDGGRVMLRTIPTDEYFDLIIMDWENLLDSKETPIPCTKENKLMLMMKSEKFENFIKEKLAELGNVEKNSLKPQDG